MHMLLPDGACTPVVMLAIMTRHTNVCPRRDGEQNLRNRSSSLWRQNLQTVENILSDSIPFARNATRKVSFNDTRFAGIFPVANVGKRAPSSPQLACVRTSPATFPFASAPSSCVDAAKMARTFLRANLTPRWVALVFMCSPLHAGAGVCGSLSARSSRRGCDGVGRREKRRHRMARVS